MGRLAARFPSFGATYDSLRMRELVRHLEVLFGQVVIDTTRGAYAVTSSTALGSEDDVVLVDTSGGAVTVTLPVISDSMVRLKREYAVVLTDATNTLTVAPSGTDTVVGDTDVVVTVQWTALRFRATPGNWVIV